VFQLPRAVPLSVSITRPAPDCRPVLSFARSGRAGANALRLRQALAGRPLGRGIYRLVVRGPRGLVLARRLVVGQAGTTYVLRAPGLGGACRRTGVASATHVSARPARAVRSPAPATAAPRAVSAAAFPHPKRPEPFGQRLLGTVFTKQLNEAPAWLRPIMLAFLAAAILLLGTAALPQRVLPDGRALAVLERRRLGLALSGVAVVLAIAIAALLS
jgi:hypothetical protein